MLTFRDAQTPNFQDSNGICKMARGDKLTAREQLFIAEYLKDLDQTAACIRAGYSEKHAAKFASNLMKLPKVANAIQWAMDGRAQRLRIDSDNVLEEIATIAFYDIGDIARMKITNPEQIADLPLRVRKAIVGWKWDKWGNLVLEFISRLEYHKLLCAHLKICNPTIDVNVAKQREPMTPDEAMRHLREALESEDATERA